LQTLLNTLFLANQKSLICHATEVKLDPDEFDYAQLVGQNLLHANFNFHNQIISRENGDVITSSLALSGWNVRIMTLRCSYNYLESVNRGIPDQTSSPEIRLSKPYSLLKMDDRKAIIGALKGRKNNLRLALNNIE